MYILRKLFLFGMLTAFFSPHAIAGLSPVYPDAGHWNTFAVSYGLTKHVSVLFTEECRIRENYARLNLFYTNIGIEYKANKYLKTSLVYRWIDKYVDENQFSYRHRLMWDATVKYPYNAWSFSYRHRLQVENRNIYSSESGVVPEWYSRNKFEVSYALNSKFSPYISGEFRYQLHDPRNLESDHTWHRTRWQGGVDYEYSKSSKFGVYYLIQKEYNVSAPENIYITGLEYSLTLNKQ